MLVTLTVWFSVGCAGDGTGLDDNGLPVGTGGLPPAGAATLSGDAQPIFTANCAFSGCHGGTSPAQNMNLGSGLSFANLVGIASLQVPGMQRINPSKPDSSYLIFKVLGTHSTVGGVGGRMPLGAGPLSAAEILTLTEWVENGAPNN